MAIAFKYCSCQIDSTKQSFKEALASKGEHRVSECWINTIYDNFQDKLLRPDKTKNVITRETILEDASGEDGGDEWCFYDDTNGHGLVITQENMMCHPYAPSQYGELFIYTLVPLG